VLQRALPGRVDACCAGASARPGDSEAGSRGVLCVLTAMTWLSDSEVGAARRFVRALAEVSVVSDLCRRAPAGLAQLVPADVLAWDRVELATGVVLHAVTPAEAEPPGAFAAHVRGAADHPLLSAHAAGRRAALRLSETDGPQHLSRSDVCGDLLHPSGFVYGIAIGIRTGRGEAVVAGLGRSEREFSERDRDLLNLVRPGLEDALQTAEARERLVLALTASPPSGTAVVLLDRNGEIEQSSLDAERWLAEHFGAAEHPGWLPVQVAGWLALPPRPPLVSVREGRRLTVQLLLGDPPALLLEEDVASFRPEALRALGLTGRDTEVLCAAAANENELEIAAELFLSLHAVRERLERIEAKLDVHTARAAVAQALSEST
jgi:DNA-binding CsgD family transcriptional regulator